MSNLTYNWKRFWCPRTESMNFSEDGYLANPDTEWGRTLNPHVVPFESIANIPCLVLLGEPGIGKTWAIQTQKQVIEGQIAAAGAKSLWFNLNSYGTEVRLIRDIFENPDFLSWVKGDAHLHLFLDSLDECQLSIETLAPLLIEKLKTCPIQRLSLRIACRTADWPTFLEDGLQQLWNKKEEIGFYELVPLRKVDVEEAVKANGLDPTHFLKELDDKKIVPLAIKPITLRLLINLFKSEQMPPSQVELYSRGCRQLCDEDSESRKATRKTGVLTADERMAIAARIAAVTIFSRKNAIWIGVDRGDVPPGDTTLRELSGGIEIVNGKTIQIDELVLREALGTGLFSSRGSNRLDWAHQSYAEFLAAQYLLKHDISWRQISSIVVHPGDPQHKLVPQLHQTSAWLALMNPNVFTKIVETEPEVLLQQEMVVATVGDRQLLVENLLKACKAGKLLGRKESLKSYQKLAHPSLAFQLKHYIADKGDQTVAREIAIKTAQACNVSGLQEDLLSIALDNSQSLDIRIDAAYAVEKIGDSKTKARMKPLLVLSENDVWDNLRGCALRALWPTHLTAKKLFDALAPPQRKNHIGAYQMFFREELISELKISDLPIALDWVRQYKHRELPHSLADMADEIVMKAWDHLETPGVGLPFSELAVQRLRDRDALVESGKKKELNQKIARDVEKRRQFISTLIPKLLAPDASIWLVYSQTPLILHENLPWAVEQLRKSTDDQTKNLWVRLIDRLFRFGESSHLDSILVACLAEPILAKQFSAVINPVRLNSPEADAMRKAYKEQQGWEKSSKKEKKLKPPPVERVAQMLSRCEKGELTAFWMLTEELGLEPTSTHYRNGFDADVAVFPGWEAADLQTKSRIVQCAKNLLLHGEIAKKEQWLGTHTLYNSDLAAYRALRLIQLREPEFLESLSRERWGKFAPIILGGPWEGNREEAHQNLISATYHHAPTEVLELLSFLIDEEDKGENGVFVVRDIEHWWDTKLAEFLFVKVRDSNLKPVSVGRILEELLEHDFASAEEWARTLIPNPLPAKGTPEWERALVASDVLMTHSQTGCWETIWPAIQQEEFGKELISRIAASSDEREGHFLRRFTESQLADLYVLIVRYYPHSQDPQHDGAHMVGPREQATYFREAVLEHLKKRSTEEACEAIQHISKQLPHLQWLKWTLQDAEEMVRESSWNPPSSGEILAITSSREKRLVRSGEELLDVVVESLRRFEEKLHSETSGVQDLWDKDRPKDEGRVSDRIKRHLDEDLKERGVVANREVEIRRVKSKGVGERTDIHIDAVIQDVHGNGYDGITVIIETKGCWNSELNSAMKDQLVDRYMQEVHCRYGIYLVGWFNCDQWSDKDDRKKDAPKESLEEAQLKFSDQAKNLSLNMKVKAVVLNAALGGVIKLEPTEIE